MFLHQTAELQNTGSKIQQKEQKNRKLQLQLETQHTTFKNWCNTRQKIISKYIAKLNNTSNRQNLVDIYRTLYLTSLMAQTVKNLPGMQETQV